MTVRQHFDSAQRKPRYSKEEFARSGDEIYKSQVRQQVEEGNRGKIVAIDNLQVVKSKEFFDDNCEA